MKNKTLLITLTLVIASISLSCQALRPTYPGYTGGYALARKQPAAKKIIAKKRTIRAKKTIAEQIRDLQVEIRRLERRNITLLSGKVIPKVTTVIRNNKGFIKKHQAKIQRLRRQQPKKPRRQKQPKPRKRPKMQTRN